MRAEWQTNTEKDIWWDLLIDEWMALSSFVMSETIDGWSPADDGRQETTESSY